MLSTMMKSPTNTHLRSSHRSFGRICQEHGLEAITNENDIDEGEEGRLLTNGMREGNQVLDGVMEEQR